MHHVHKCAACPFLIYLERQRHDLPIFAFHFQVLVALFLMGWLNSYVKFKALILYWCLLRRQDTVFKYCSSILGSTKYGIQCLSSAGWAANKISQKLRTYPPLKASALSILLYFHSWNDNMTQIMRTAFLFYLCTVLPTLTVIIKIVVSYWACSISEVNNANYSR